MTDPFERVETVDTGPLSPHGTRKVCDRRGQFLTALPKSLTEPGEERERYHHPETDAILLVPEGEEPPTIEE